MKKLAGLCLVVSILFSSFLFSQDEKVRVKADRASIYAEEDTSSYRIEVLKKGTVLTLFGAGQSKEGWWYVHYQSPRWGSKVTGFVQADLVEKIDGKEEKPMETDKEVVVEKKEPEKILPVEVKPVEVKKKPETKEPPEKVDVVTTEESVAVALRSGKIYALPRFGDFKTETMMIEIPERQEPKEKLKERELQKELAGEEKLEEKPEAKLPEKQKPRVREKPEAKKKPEEITTMRTPVRRALFTMSLGYGPSFGGLGSFVQVNTRSGFSLHGGVGYYPTTLFYPEFDWVEGKMMYSVGIKYYLPWGTNRVRPYLDLQYGGLSVEAVRVVTGIWYYAYVYENLQKILWGPSLLGGVEVRFGSLGLNGSLGISYVLTKWDYWDQPAFLTADIGLLLYF